ncbi:MAG: TIGR04282 family arsenosugar biosynthesis glycosyltransferase [Gammaproteobacteria bacterium]|nr:TIGR04282 family arsenosugar biosynthesis glycosyltransferase [Gammaproteobacteria bacterium]MDP2139351.1 TIGR04282 family arsenosugar biosynthesis glycosyltransferase [Gammaproteobacteria bacterium]MDP2347266.1 TIGR04282 family arsenosugar biosynthesis glycosyltransferase [Gammaproteobacteria bacterium]
MNENKLLEFPSAVVALFAKEPRLGHVKTRLQPQLGAEGALALHDALIRYVFGNLEQADLCPVELWVAGSPQSPQQHHELFLSICNNESIHDQKGADLGARMHHAANAVLTRAECVVLIGADCPSVDASYLREALTLLQSGVPVVIGPAEDGGYVLLGLREAPEYLFDAMPWGTDSVLKVTRQRLRQHNAHHVELAPRWDVDRPEDLQRLTALSPPFMV